MPRKNPIEEIAEEIRENLRIPFPATSGAIREAFLKTQEPTGSLYIPVCQDSYPEAKKAIDSITRCPGSNLENQHTENIRQKVTLAVFMPKKEFLWLCSTYQKEGFLCQQPHPTPLTGLRGWGFPRRLPIRNHQYLGTPR